MSRPGRTVHVLAYNSCQILAKPAPGLLFLVPTVDDMRSPVYEKDTCGEILGMPG